MKRIITLFFCCLLLCGCTTTRNVMDPDTYQVCEDGVKYFDYDIEITSEPPGADIEWDKEPLGKTPVTKTLYGYVGSLNRITVKALPSAEGGHAQTKVVGGAEAIPRNIHFIMTEQ